MGAKFGFSQIKHKVNLPMYGNNPEIANASSIELSRSAEEPGVDILLHGNIIAIRAQLKLLVPRATK